MSDFHKPVLLKEVTEFLRISKGKKYIDATIGGGGHSFEILERGGIVLGIDVDQEAIDYVKKKFEIRNSKFETGERLTLVRGNFRDIDKIAHANGFEKIAGIIFDLGVSSYQLETPQRGFSFQKMGPLDMRMDQDLGVKAKDLLQILTKGELYELFHKLGEESNAWRISEHIVRARGVKPIETTQDLVEIIQKGLNKRFTGIHAATKAFQALRIGVNDELNSLRDALPQAVRLLERNGRILVISFHSLEDRIVKQSFIEFSRKNMGIIITKKPLVPTQEEVINNKRSRSAKLRVFETRSTSSG